MSCPRIEKYKLQAQLIDLIKADDLAGIRSLVTKTPANMNGYDMQKNTPFSYMIKHGSLELVKLGVELGGLPMHYRIIFMGGSIIELAAGNTRKDNRILPYVLTELKDEIKNLVIPVRLARGINDALQQNNLEMVKYILEHNVNPSSAIHSAISHSEEATQLLINHGADLNHVKNIVEDGRIVQLTALQFAIRNGKNYSCLMESSEFQKSDMKDDTDHLSIDKDGNNGWHRFMQQPHQEELFLQLLDLPIKKNIVNQAGFTPLMIAISHRTPFEIERYIHVGFNPDINTPHGTVGHIAIKHIKDTQADHTLLTMLVNNNLDINAKKNGLHVRKMAIAALKVDPVNLRETYGHYRLYGNKLNPLHNIIVNQHNMYRKQYGVPPLQLSQGLSKFAQEWADQLVKEKKMYHRDQKRYGENLYWCRGAITHTNSVDAWMREVKYYDYQKNNWWPNAAHFSQVLWHSSRLVGVGIASEGDETFIVCNYDPPGNTLTQRPYQESG